MLHTWECKVLCLPAARPGPPNNMCVGNLPLNYSICLGCYAAMCVVYWHQVHAASLCFAFLCAPLLAGIPQKQHHNRVRTL